jgi:pimeloyl-ACP methyl ester carboxylesterase
MAVPIAAFLAPCPPQPDLPLLLYFPGLDGSGQLFYRQLVDLQAQFDVRCLAISAQAGGNWQALAQWVVEWVKHQRTVDPRRPITLCGESFGGCLAMQIAAIAPDWFAQLILVNPASSFSRRPWLGWGSQVSLWLPEGLYQTGTMTFLPLLAAFDRVTLADRRALATAVKAVPASVSVERIAMLSNFQTPTRELQHFSRPVLILGSGKDQLLPSVAEAYRLKGILPQAQVVELPQSGHACLLEQAMNLARIMKAHNFELNRMELYDRCSS